MNHALKTLIFGASILFLTALFGLFASAGYYSYHFESCCTYGSIGVYNAQGDPSYLRYDPYSYEADPYYTRSLPSYPYEYYPTVSYPHYVYSYAYPSYSRRIYRGYNYVYPSYAYRID